MTDVIDFPKNYTFGMSGVPKQGQAVIPEDFPIKKCKPALKKGKEKAMRPRKAGRIISWQVAEALAPEADLSYMEQEKKHSRRFLRSVGLEEALREEMLSEIRRLKKENKDMSSEE